MQFEALKVYCDVARQRSFSRAADLNEVSQSAVSQIVNQLEKRLGVRLVDRSCRPLQLTAEGKAYYEGCRKLVEQYLEIEASIRRTAAPERSRTVRVAAIYSVGLRDMDQYVRRFEHQEPGAQVEIEYLHPDRVYEQVEGGSADFGLVSFPQPSRKLVSVPWREEEMVVACPPGHPFAEKGRVAVRDLDGQRYVAFDRGLEIRRKVDRLLKDHGAAVSVAHEFDNIENIKQSIEVSGGVALLPAPALERELWAGTLAAVPLADARFVRPLAILHRRSPPPGAVARRFMDLLRQPEEPSVAAGPGAFWAARGGDR